MTITIKHNGGFFSCCSVRLYHIIEYFNTHKNLPDYVDSSIQFDWYKINKSDDITFDYFKHYDKININITNDNDIDYHHDHQFNDFSKLEYTNICQFVRKYFSPSQDILTLVETIEEKYSINDYSNICVLFYRGNDKVTETSIAPYEEFIQKAHNVLESNPNIKFLIQSDETEFIEKIQSTFPINSFYFPDEIRHMRKCCSSVDKESIFKGKNYEFSKLYLAITIIMSKCKYIVCGSGNCSIWIMLYREHSNGVYQYLNGNWV